MTLREIQQPIKDRYRDEPDAAEITLRAVGTIADGAMSCSVDLGRALYAAGAHPGVGGSGRVGLLRRPAAGSARGMRPDHLPDGRREHGPRRRDDLGHGRGRSRPPGHARDGRRAGRLQGDPGPVRVRRRHPARPPGASQGAHRALLRGIPDAARPRRRSRCAGCRASGTNRDVGDGLAVELLGHFELSVGGRRIEGIRTPRLESLVAYLLLHCDRPGRARSARVHAVARVERRPGADQPPPGAAPPAPGAARARPPHRARAPDRPLATRRSVPLRRRGVRGRRRARTSRRPARPSRRRSGCTTARSCRPAMTTGSRPTASGSRGSSSRPPSGSWPTSRSAASIAARCSSCAG